MHGDINERNFVLKEDDYYNYNNDFPVISQLIQSLIVNNTLLFIGYSLSDTTFNSIYRLISSQLGNNVNNAYLFTTDNLNEFEVRYYDNLNIKVVGGESTKTKLKYGLSEKGL
uniref:SIR2 family protein n=1 Tax=uncultured Anaerococcus sp. TaxID=293428 RepID=UPI00260B10FB